MVVVGREHFDALREMTVVDPRAVALPLSEPDTPPLLEAAAVVEILGEHDVTSVGMLLDARAAGEPMGILGRRAIGRGEELAREGVGGEHESAHASVDRGELKAGTVEAKAVLVEGGRDALALALWVASGDGEPGRKDGLEVPIEGLGIDEHVGIEPEDEVMVTKLTLALERSVDEIEVGDLELAHEGQGGLGGDEVSGPRNLGA